MPNVLAQERSANSLRSALVAFSKSLSAEVAGSGVTVNTIVPWADRDAARGAA
jgi:NAD(P)-dependent dehydrogenase (short-subunit alcohol dehydrogenase family)